MDFKQVAEDINKGNYSRILHEADQMSPQQEKDGDVRLLVAKAYFNGKMYKKSLEWYWQCLEYDVEESFENILFILKNKGDIDSIKRLEQLLIENDEGNELISICHYEYLRRFNYNIEEKIASLKEYVDTTYEPLYMIRLAELYILDGDTDEAVSVLSQCSQLYPSSEYSDKSGKLYDSLIQGRAIDYIKNNSIESELYVELEEARVEEEGIVEKHSREKIEERNAENKKHKSSLMAMVRKPKSDKRKKYKHDESINIEESFESICGMKEIRESLGNMYRILRLEEERRDRDIYSSILSSTHFTIAGNKATGKTLLATTIHKVLYAFGIRGAEQPELIEARDLGNYFDSLMQEEDKTIIIENIEKCRNSDGIYDADNIVWPLKKLLNRKKETLSVIITGSRDGIKSLLAQGEEIVCDLYKQFEIPQYSIDEYMDICISIAGEKKLIIDDKAKWYIRKLITRNYKKSGFSNIAFLTGIIERASANMADRISAEGCEKDIDLATLKYDDFLSDADGDEEIEKALKELENFIGLAKVKEAVARIIDETNVFLEKNERGLEGADSSISRHLVFYGSPGTGKTTVARIIGKIYYYLGILPEKKFVECTSADLVGQYVGSTAVKARSKIQEAVGGVLFIDEAYMLSDDKSQFNAEAVAELLVQMENHKDDLIVIMAGYEREIDHLFKNTNEGLLSRFPIQNRIMFEDYSMKELKEIFCLYIDKEKLILEQEAEELIIPMLEEKAKEDGFNNARGVRNTFEYAKSIMLSRIAAIPEIEKTDDDYRYMRKCDLEYIIKERPHKRKNKDELLDELDGLTGLALVKSEIRNLIKHMEAEDFFAKQKGQKGSIHVDNMLFLGNPGTGKTTVARIFAQLLEEIGILEKKGHFLETSRDDFVSKIVGESVEKTRKLIINALGGVLFIDEAYALCKDQNDSYGREAVDTLVKMMEDNKDRLVVIAAGYSKEMKEFLDTNSGLKSRFPTVINFEDYTEDELLVIFKEMAQKDGYQIEKDCNEPIKQYLSTMRRQKHFGNARDVRNIYLKVERSMKIRQYEKAQLQDKNHIDIDNEIIKQDFYDAIGMSQKTNDNRSGDVEYLLRRMDELIGLSSVKKDIHDLINFINGIKTMKGESVNIAEQLGRMHMAFLGAPGTGKTMMARLIGKIYYKLGILKSDVFVECDKSALVGEYVGQTEIKTNKKVDEAMGGVLFVDEAYGLSSDSYGEQAINVLLKRMEDQRKDFMVILAGYTAEMNKLFELNVGFKSRVPNIFVFENYTSDELIQIFELIAGKNSMKLDDISKKILYDYFEIHKKEPSFANARSVETVYDKIHKTIYRLLGENATLLKSGEDIIITENIMNECIH